MALIRTKKAPKISVCMATWNREKYLHQTIESILNQTFTEFEFIIINDGSTDNSKSILKTFAALDDRIVLIHQENAGCYPSRNRALSLAKSKYTAVVDSDDPCRKDRLEKQYNFLESNPDHVCVGSFVRVMDAQGNLFQIREYQTTHEQINQSLLNADGMSHPCLMFRTDVVRSFGGYNQSAPCGADYHLALMLSEHGKVANLPHPLTYWRIHNDSISSAKQNKQKQMSYHYCKLAHARRNLPFDLTFEQYCIQHFDTHTYHDPSMISAMLSNYALRSGNFSAARKYALNSIRQSPFKINNWKLLKWSLTG